MSESLGSKYQNKNAGNFGIAGTLSFNGNKIITTGAGGAIITNNENLSKKIKHITKTSKLNKDHFFDHDQIGYNYRMPNICASLGISQLKKIKFLIKNKRELHNKYRIIFSRLKNTKIMEENNYSKSNFWLNCLILEDDNKKLIKEVIDNANKLNFEIRPIWNPIHTLKFCRKFPKDNLENTMYAFNTTLCLPSSAMLNKKITLKN